MKTLTGLVPVNDVPPTVEIVSTGMIVRFYKHGPQMVWFTPQMLLEWIEKKGGKKLTNLQFTVRVLKNTVVFSLRKPVSGHGTLRLKKDEFLEALKGA